jgi:hypothetical protein
MGFLCWRLWLWCEVVWLSECEWENEHPPYNSDSQITNTKIINFAFTKTHERYSRIALGAGVYLIKWQWNDWNGYITLFGFVRIRLGRRWLLARLCSPDLGCFCLRLSSLNNTKSPQSPQISQQQDIPKKWIDIRDIRCCNMFHSTVAALHLWEWYPWKAKEKLNIKKGRHQ